MIRFFEYFASRHMLANILMVVALGGGTFAKTIAESFNVSDFVQIVRELDKTKTYSVLKYNCKHFVKDVEVNIRKKSVKKAKTANDNHIAKKSMTGKGKHVSKEQPSHSSIPTNEG